MTDALPDPAPLPADWQPLPPRARALFTLTGALGFGLPALLGCVPILRLVEPPALAVALAGALTVLAAALGIWLARKQYRHTRWRLDADGFALARGNWWRRETRVPASRVQHLDLRHGPLERRWHLATLVIHTAGSKFGAVSVSGLDADDAERLRDRLARQLDADDAV
jgi:membrane protein YdbS with pleckstrin-like domain